MSAKQSPLAFIATEEFTQRIGDLRRAVHGQGFGLQQAERIASCWLAIAAACGADLPELRDPDALRQIGIDPAASPSRRLTADEIAPRAEWLAELVRARDAALRKVIAFGGDRSGQFSPEMSHARLRSFGLCSLALHLGAPMPFGTGASANAHTTEPERLSA